MEMTIMDLWQILDGALVKLLANDVNATSGFCFF